MACASSASLRTVVPFALGVTGTLRGYLATGTAPKDKARAIAIGTMALSLGITAGPGKLIPTRLLVSFQACYRPFSTPSLCDRNRLSWVFCGTIPCESVYGPCVHLHIRGPNPVGPPGFGLQRE